MNVAAEIGRNPASKHHILSLSVENEQTDAGQDGQPCLVKTILKRERGQGNINYLCAAALRSIVLRYAGGRSDISHTCLYLFPFVCFEMTLFPSIVCTIFPLCLCMEGTSYVLSFRMVFVFYLVATGWIFDISLLLCENSINQKEDG